MMSVAYLSSINSAIVIFFLKLTSHSRQLVIVGKGSAVVKNDALCLQSYAI